MLAVFMTGFALVEGAIHIYNLSLLSRELAYIPVWQGQIIYYVRNSVLGWNLIVSLPRMVLSTIILLVLFLFPETGKLGNIIKGILGVIALYFVSLGFIDFLLVKTGGSIASIVMYAMSGDIDPQVPYYMILNFTRVITNFWLSFIPLVSFAVLIVAILSNFGTIKERPIK